MPWPSGRYFGAEPGFGLRFEHRFFHAHAHGGDDAFADVLGVEIFFAKVVAHHFHHRFAEGVEVGAALRGVLAVDERVVLLAVMVAVGHGNFDVFARR
jgi:hypothetical protein